VLRRAYELGANFFDTADSYGPHVDEELIAEALHPYPKDFVIATKGGLLRPRAAAWDEDGRPEHLRKAIEGSLKRLKLERIDLYQLHAIDPKVPLEDSLGPLVDAQSAGKIRHIGVSNFNVAELEARAQGGEDRLGAERVQPRQPYFRRRGRPLREARYRLPAVVPIGRGGGSSLFKSHFSFKKTASDPGSSGHRLAARPLAGGATHSGHQLDPASGAEYECAVSPNKTGGSRMNRVFALLFALAAGAAQAQSYPDKPIRIVVGYAAGGGNDIIVRVMQPELQKGLGQPVIVENKPGAQSIIAAELVARSPGDGYTLLMGPSGPMTINPATYSKLPYDAQRDFAPISMICQFPLLVTGRREAADPQREGADRVRQGEPWQGELRVERRHLPDHHRDVQPAHRQQGS
jgi:hypothetical protein